MKTGSIIAITFVIAGIIVFFFANGTLSFNQENLDESIQSIPQNIKDASNTANDLATQTTTVIRDTLSEQIETLQLEPIAIAIEDVSDDVSLSRTEKIDIENIKEILENGVDIPIIVTIMKDPTKITTIKRIPDKKNGNPIKIVTGKKNCAIFRIETSSIQKLLTSLEKDKGYSEFVILSPFTKDGTEFSRMLFLDAGYVKRNEKYFLAFDPLAKITYNRGVITLIGDEMWRVQQVASRTSAKIGEAGLNILNMDAQEETSRIIIVVEDSEDNIKKAISAIHSETSKINFIN